MSFLLFSNQQAILCWSCSLPFFGNNPDMFDGDHVACLQIAEEEPIYSNRRYQNGPFQYREIESPLLVTIPSPVSVFVEADPQPQGHIDAMSSHANVSIPPVLIDHCHDEGIPDSRFRCPTRLLWSILPAQALLQDISVCAWQVDFVTKP
jgi:hypothetical protein